MQGSTLHVGDTFGDYRALKLLGSGGMGEVWLLESAVSGVQVAAKILDPKFAADHDARKRFVREAELAMSVKHANIVDAYDVGEDPDTGFAYIIMEYVPGGTLSDRLRERGSLPLAYSLSVVQAIASALALAKQKGIVHRDIKPSNIMFDANGTPKLADLGVARVDSSLLGSDVESATVTQTDMLLGTPAYMAPEQMLDAHRVDFRADIYSLGIVLFEMLTGVRPNKDATVFQLMAKAVSGDPIPDVRSLKPEIPASVAKMVSMMCMPDAERRISSPEQIVKWCERQIEAGRRKTPPPPAVREQKPSLPIGMLTLAAASVCVVFLLLIMRNSRVRQVSEASNASGQVRFGEIKERW